MSVDKALNVFEIVVDFVGVGVVDVGKAVFAESEGNGLAGCFVEDGEEGEVLGRGAEVAGEEFDPDEIESVELVVFAEGLALALADEVADGGAGGVREVLADDGGVAMFAFEAAELVESLEFDVSVVVAVVEQDGVGGCVFADVYCGDNAERMLDELVGGFGEVDVGVVVADGVDNGEFVVFALDGDVEGGVVLDVEVEGEDLFVLGVAVEAEVVAVVDDCEGGVGPGFEGAVCGKGVGGALGHAGVVLGEESGGRALRAFELGVVL